jgi:hypothetical protein
MSDIADKIYAATGLTLGAEAAAKVGHMIRLARQEAADEIEKLQAENAKFAASNHAYRSDYQEARGEIEKLRAALRGLLEWAGPIAGDTQIVSERAYEEETVAIARAALGEKE